MKGIMVLLVLLAMVLVVGCGGAGQGISPPAELTMGGVSPAAYDSTLVGTWVIVHVTKDGADTACSIVEAWPVGTVRQVLEFSPTGACVRYFYGASGSAIKTDSGTWSTSAGSITFAWPSGSYVRAYSLSGNVLTTTHSSAAGHAYVKQYAREVALTARDTALFKTWKATAVSLNGVSRPVSYLTGSTTYAQFARSFAANGASQRYLLGGAGSQLIMLPKQGVQNWASGGGVVKYLTGNYQSAIYTIASGALTIWQLDAQGNTLKVTYGRYGAAGAHDPLLLGARHPVSGTINGVSKPLAQIFGWPTGSTSMKMIFAADGTCEQPVYTGTALTSDELDKWYTAAGAINFTFARGPQAVSYVFSGTSLTCSWTDSGGQKVVVFAKG
ncbi:MAG TPA: lipocalin family protein [Armatimonadota bacterium]